MSPFARAKSAKSDVLRVRTGLPNPNDRAGLVTSLRANDLRTQPPPLFSQSPVEITTLLRHPLLVPVAGMPSL